MEATRKLRSISTEVPMRNLTAYRVIYLSSPPISFTLPS